MSDNINSTASCDTVCKTLTEINGALINSLIERITEMLSDINTAIESSGEVDKSMLSQLEVLKKELVDKCSHIIMDEDRDKVVIFLRRISNIVSSWSDSERSAILELLEHSGRDLLLVKTKLRRLYWIIVSAGALTILTQVGAPDWIQKLVKLIFAA